MWYKNLLELSEGITDMPGPLALLENRHGATIVAIAIAALMASLPASGNLADWSMESAGKGGLILWPLFGATNQLLAGLAFLVVTFYLWRRNVPVWFLVIPMVFMLVMPIWAMSYNLFHPDSGWLVAEKPNYLLGCIGIATIALELWMIFEAFKAFPKGKGSFGVQSTGRLAEAGELMIVPFPWEKICQTR